MSGGCKVQKRICPICKRRKLNELITFAEIPVFVNVLCDTVEQAERAVCGTQKLVQCDFCGFIFNCEFESEKVCYGEGYHAERGNSLRYHQHIHNTLDTIESVEPLKGKTILEVACGTGEFLQAAVRRGPTQCIGVDPSAEVGNWDGFTIRQMLFDQSYLEQYPQKIDVLINRHMIEHMTDPLEMLQFFAQALPEGGLLYLETPRLDWILQNRVFYDFPYKHCSYYTDKFMLRLLQAAGFAVEVMKLSYEGQYFSICARKSGGVREIASAEKTELEAVKNGFKKTKVTLSRAKKQRLAGANQETVRFPDANYTQKDGILLWGAAAKGVMCCNLLKEFGIVGCVDQNHNKQGKYIPGTGEKVIAPSDMLNLPAKIVLVENDVYLDEIRTEVQKIDSKIQVRSLNSLLEIGIRVK